MNRSLSMAATLCAILTAAPALAQEQHVTVSYADLNLASHAGRAALTARLTNAAQSLCGDPLYGPPNLVQRQIHQQCTRNTLRRALATLPSDVLVRLHESQTAALER